MGYMAVFVVLVGFAVLYFLIREKIEIIESNEDNPEKIALERREIRKKLLKKYLSQSKNITLRVYQQLTGLSLDKAAEELSQFTEEGFLYQFGKEGQVVYYDPKSSYEKEELYIQINRKM